MLDDLFSSQTQSRLVSSLIAAAIFYLVYLLIKSVGRRILIRVVGSGDQNSRRVDTLYKVGSRALLILMILVLFLVFGEIWELNFGGLLALGAVFGAALGFGAQDLVKDLIAGFFIIAEDQFHIGDVVKIADTEGTVEDIQFRITVLRDVEGNKHFVPNGDITVASNYTSVFARPVLDVGIAYQEDVDNAMAVMRDELEKMVAADEWSSIIKEPPEVLGVQDLADSAVVIRARLTVSADNRWSTLREARRRIKNRFDAEGIEIPFPHMTIYQGEG